MRWGLWILCLPWFAFAQEHADSTLVECPQALISLENQHIQCLETDTPPKTKWDAEIYFGGLMSSQLVHATRPISQWGLKVGIPITKHVQTSVSVDNPALGANLPSKLIQPARSSYTLDVKVQNFYKDDQSGIRVVFTHTSDHTVEALLDHANNSFHTRDSGGELNAAGIEKTWDQDRHQTTFDIRWIDLGGHVNIARIIEIPGYLLTDYTAHGVMIKSTHAYAFGKKNQHSVKASASWIKNLQKSTLSKPSYRADYVLAGASLNMQLAQLHPDLYFMFSNITAIPFAIAQPIDYNTPMLRVTRDTQAHEKIQSMFEFGLVFDLR